MKLLKSSIWPDVLAFAKHSVNRLFVFHPLSIELTRKKILNLKSNIFGFQGCIWFIQLCAVIHSATPGAFFRIWKNFSLFFFLKSQDKQTVQYKEKLVLVHRTLLSKSKLSTTLAVVRWVFLWCLHLWLRFAWSLRCWWPSKGSLCAQNPKLRIHNAHSKGWLHSTLGSNTSLWG